MKTSGYQFCPFCGSSFKKTSRSGYTCASCQGELYLNSKPTASVVAVCGNEVLLAQRGIEPWKGLLNPVGGFLEDGEEPLDGAAREFHEETGLQLIKKDLVLQGFIGSRFPYRGVTYNLLNLLYILPLAEKIQPQPHDDVMDFFWVPLGEGTDFPYPLTEYMKDVWRQLLELKAAGKLGHKA